MFLSLFFQNTNHLMQTLLSDLLNYSNIGKKDPAPKHINLSTVAANCCELLNLPQGLTIDVDDTDLFLPYGYPGWC
jgi:hypothetical protein